MACRLLTGYFETLQAFAVVDFLPMTVGDISGDVELLGQIEAGGLQLDGPAELEQRIF
jgi:hypothetical protein